MPGSAESRDAAATLVEEQEGQPNNAAGERTSAVTVTATTVAILVGGGPDLSFLPSWMRDRLPDPSNATGALRTDGTLSSHPLHVPVDEMTFEVLGDDGRRLAEGPAHPM